MSIGWENHEPSPIEFMHGRLMDEFHKWRKSKGNEIEVLIDGSEFNRIIAAAKKATYEKYKKLRLDKPVLKSDLWEASKVRCDLCGHQWIAVRPEGLTKLECPICHNMTLFENIMTEGGE